MSVERLSTYALRIHNWLHVERHHHKWKRGQQRFLFLSILKPSHQCLIVRCARNYLPRRASGCHWSIMSSADTRDWATAWGYFPVRSIATFAALKNFCAASLYTIAYSHRLRPVFQTFCLTSSPYLLELFFFRKKKKTAATLARAVQQTWFRTEVAQYCRRRRGLAGHNPFRAPPLCSLECNHVKKKSAVCCPL